MEKHKYDSIIFDLDGTLWDAVECVVTIWNDALEKAGIEPTLNYEQLSRCMGLRIEQIFDRVIPQATQQQRELIKENCAKTEQKYLAEKGGVLYDNVEDTLAALRKTHRLFIVSNCGIGYINAFFKAHGLDKYFEDFECAGRTGLPKGDNIRLLAERHNLRAPVYIGDTVSDFEAANAAKVPFIHAAYGFGEVECDVKALSFSQIPSLV